MTRKEAVIEMIFTLLDLIENQSNHRRISEIRGLLNELRNM